MFLRLGIVGKFIVFKVISRRKIIVFKVRNCWEIIVFKVRIY